MRMHRRRRRQAHRLADLAHGRRIPLSVNMGVYELEYLALSIGQIHWSGSLVEHVFERKNATGAGRSQMWRGGLCVPTRRTPIRCQL